MAKIKEAKILIVEDEIITAKALESTLLHLGYQVPAMADTGVKAINAAAEVQPDLVLMDIRLKGDMDGIQAAEQIRSVSNTPIIFLTAYAEDEKLERAKSILPFGYLLKPVQDRDLRVTIEMTLHATKAQKINELRQNVLINLHELKNATTKEIFNYVLDQCLVITESELSFLGLISADESVMDIHAWSESAMEQCFISDKPRQFSIAAAGLWGEVVRQRSPIVVNDYENSTEFKKGIPVGHVPIRNFMSVPTFDKGRIVCIAAVANKEGDYQNTEIQELKLILDTTWQIIQQHRSETEKKVLEKQLLQTQKMEAIGTLAGGIAHDFNNILQPIIGYAQMGLDDAKDSSPHQRYFSQILSASNRAKELVRQILMFSRQGELDLKPLELKLVIKEVINFLRSSLPATIKIQTSIDKNCGMVEADATQIHQVIMNLVSNSYHAMQEKGGHLQVDLKPVDISLDANKEIDLPTGPYVCLSVSDTGEGMEQAVVDRIFDPYYTTKEKGKGTGLGLATVMGIVKNHKGQIRVASQLGNGTTVKIFFPQSTIKVERDASKTLSSNPTGTESILLVDDEFSVVELQRDMLEPLGYDITFRTSSIDAYEAFKANPEKFDLIITDMTMPNMTGDKLAAKILSIRPQIPIIICTGFSDMIDEDKAKKIGAKTLLSKPITQSNLANTIRGILDQANM